MIFNYLQKPQWANNGKMTPTLIYKKNDKNDINNYRPIVLLTTIYKIWATVMDNPLHPIMHLLTNELQCAYKSKHSAQDVIHFVKTNLIIIKAVHGEILLDLTKAFGAIGRRKLWPIL